ncbi:MAG: Rpn family recombination-promoting nuclease/putative transposase [Bacteroidota bacterium]
MKNQDENSAQKKDDDNLPTHPHDLIFRVMIKNPNHAREILEAKAPKELLAILKLDTLRLSDTSYVDETLAEQIADVVLLCDTDEDEPVQISYILEHKSFVPSYAPYQHMHYQDRAWGRQIQTKGMHPMPSVPVVFFHGKEKWTIKPWSHYLRGWRKKFAPYTPPGGCIFIDLSEMTDEEIKLFRYGFLIAVLLLMKHRFEAEYLLDNCNEIISFVEKDSSEPVETRIENLKYALSYLRSVQFAHWEEITKKLRTMKLPNSILDNIDEYIRWEAFTEGVEKGMEKGMEEGLHVGMEKQAIVAIFNMLEKDFAFELIASILDVSHDQVLSVQQQLAKTPQIFELLAQAKFSIPEISQRLEVSPFLVEILKDKRTA